MTVTTRLRRGAIPAAVLSSLVAGGAVALRRPRFRFVSERRTVPVPGGSLDALLTLPQRGEARGLMLFVHGDGPETAESNGFYRPWWEAATDAGYAVLCWSKPGVERSTAHDGDWQTQTMADRAAEVCAVLDWVREHPDVPHETVGLWGLSQAGLVVPAVAARREDVDLAVLVSPTINWVEQDRFQLLRELDHSGADAERREHTIAVSDQNLRLLEAGTGYEDYCAATIAGGPMDSGRWEFNALNFRTDASDDLAAVARRGVPVLLLLGDRDRNVDAPATARRYAEILGTGVDVAWFHATHTLYRPTLDHRYVREAAAARSPRALLAGGVLRAFGAFLSRHLPAAAPVPGPVPGSAQGRSLRRGDRRRGVSLRRLRS